MEIIAIGVLSVISGFLVLDRELKREALIKKLEDENAKLREAQQSRVNYRSLEEMENAAAQIAAALSHAELVSKFGQSAIDYLARAHTPTKPIK